MSAFQRFKRLAKSLIPRLPGAGERNYTLSDARMMITDLGYGIPQGTLARLTDSIEVLEDFLHSVYALEEKIGKPVMNEFAAIDPLYEPKAHSEGGKVAFTVRWKGEEWLFAEYDA